MSTAETIQRKPETQDTDERQNEEVAKKAGQAALDQNERLKELASGTDDLLDEMDEVLENNAEDFVKNYKQKGGQ